MKTKEEDKNTYYEDPAFVVVGLHRIEVGGGGTSLFGSDVKHSHAIALTISQAEKIRNRELSYDWTMAQKKMIEVWLSPAQFAEMITTMNVGDGVPGTLEYKDGQTFSMPKMETRSESFKKEIASNIVEVHEGIKSAYETAKNILVQPKALTRKEKDDLLWAIEKVERLFSDHLPFVTDQMSRSLSKMVAEAKANVDVFVVHAIQKTGLEHNAPKITENDGPDEALGYDSEGNRI